MLQLHVAVLLFGAAGVLGRMIGLPALELVAYRTVLGGIALGALSILARNHSHTRPVTSTPTFLYLACSGCLLALHWYTFFLSIEVSSVAVGLLSFSSFPAIAAVAEPLLHGLKPRLADLVTAAVVLLGLALVVPPFSADASLLLGAGIGIISGVTFAAFTLLNRRFSASIDPITIAFHQNSWACIGIVFTLLAGHACMDPLTLEQIPLVLILGLGCTALAHTLFVRALRNVSVTTASVIAALEPVYGILLAGLLLGEIPTVRACLGGLVVLGAATWASLHQRDLPAP